MRSYRLLVVILFGAVLAASQAPATIFLVRHAEKAAPSGDVPLSDAGRARAQTLTHVLADAGVRNIFVTEFQRTKETVAPSAKKFHVSPETLPAADVDRLASRLRATPAGVAVLVVGHSNTLPMILEMLGAGAVRPIDDGEYDRLFIVTIQAGRARLLTLRYGNP